MLKKLTFLNLNYNMISVLGEGAFDGLVMLERLSLYDNQIQHINVNAFKGIGRSGRACSGRVVRGEEWRDVRM